MRRARAGDGVDDVADDGAAGDRAVDGYARHLGGATDALPEAARETARGSLAGALEVTARLGPSGRPALAEAQDAFLSGMHAAFLACAVFTALGAVLVGVFAPGQPRPYARNRSA